MAVPQTLGKPLIQERKKSPIAPPRASRTLSCPVCHHSVWEYASSVRRVSLSRCAQCRLLGTTHFVTQERTIDGIYDVDAANLAIYQQQYLSSRMALYTRFLPEFERFRQTRRLLEIGSGYGYFLQMAARANWAAEGLEISPYCCHVARARGCKVQQGRIQEAELDQDQYDVVVLWDVIEHFTEPDEVIRLSRNFLRPGGALVMRTPDARALEPTLQPMRAAYRHLVYPANTAEHIFHFTPRNLSRVVANLGFHTETIDCSQPWAEHVISGNNNFVRAARRLLMHWADWRHYPYEFVLVAVKS